MLCEIVAQHLHFLLVGGFQRRIRYLVEPYQINSAIQALQQIDDSTSVSHGVIQSVKDNVLKRQSTLMREVILP